MEGLVSSGINPVPIFGVRNQRSCLFSASTLHLRKGQRGIRIGMVKKQCSSSVGGSQVGHFENTLASKETLEIWRNSDAVCFDVDSTVCLDEGIDELAEFCGAGKAVAEWTARAMGGSVPFEEALAARLSLFKPSLSQLQNFLHQNPPRLSPGVEELVQKLKPMYATSSESDSQISFAPSSIVDMEDEAKMLVDDLVPSAQKPREVDVTKDENFGHMKSSEFLTVKSSTPLPTGVQSIIPYNSKAPNVILEKLERLELLKDSDGAHEIFVEGDDEKIVRSCSNGVVRLVGLHIEAFYLEENLWSSSLEEEENVKTSEALGCDAFMRTSDSSTQIWYDFRCIIKANNIHVYLISGGFRQMINPVASILGIPQENIFANQLLFGRTGEFLGFDENEPTSRSGGKASAVQQIKKVSHELACYFFN
ncbi:phosphoserine phosphatase, chloroplastic-like [Lotus japonicus]|uniref:phosphoserine phosphatase, chloroplastic-like n=1 Tax=Lotus japonicus TaxID=34305 RepID=UPI002583D401|nr:phosphoserine phosphatase, chloroplastic-like [Lotus japonicus]